MTEVLLSLLIGASVIGGLIYILATRSTTYDSVNETVFPTSGRHHRRRDLHSGHPEWYYKHRRDIEEMVRRMAPPGTTRRERRSIVRQTIKEMIRHGLY